MLNQHGESSTQNMTWWKGPRSVSTIYGKSHAQMRKVLNSFFTPKAMAAYTHCLAELATEFCSEMAAAGQTKGEDGMKKFAFKANTELILGFESSAVTDELVARQQHLWQDWLDGLVSITINLPGFSYAHPLTSQTAYSVLLIMVTLLAR